jgi:hypothetical protein
MKKHLKSVELFLALGFATTLSVSHSSSVQAKSETFNQETTPVLLTQNHQETHHGQGGEGGLSSGNPDVDFMTTLGLMKGHLLAAQELIKQGKYAEAEPHIGHPVEELYGGIEDELSQRNLPQFKDNLLKLHDLVKSAPESSQMQDAFVTSMESLDQAIAAIPESQRQSPEFVLDVITEMLKTAAAEYEASIVNNQIVEVVEYQDARGFVIYADELYQNVATQMSKENPEDHQIIAEILAELNNTFTSITPPNIPPKEASEVYSLVSQIELHSR